MKKPCARVGSLMLALLLCVTLLPAPVRAVDKPAEVTPPPIPAEGDVWDGSTQQPTKLTKVDDVLYYEISTCAQLAFIARNSDWLGKNYLLVNDLILNDVLIEADADGNLLTDPETLKEWSPIGKSSNTFSGIFDGNGHTISGLYINQPTKDYLGLFGFSTGKLNNVRICNAFVYGFGTIGGLVGYGETIENCICSGVIKGKYRVVGGIAGYNGDQAIRCINYCSVSGTDSVGGIAGYGTQINESENHGAVFGKIAGGISGIGNHVYKCANFGTVQGDDEIGGVVGRSKGVSNCFNAGTVKGISRIGGIVGNGESLSISNCYNIGFVTSDEGDTSAGSIIGSDDVLWGKDRITGCYYLKTDEINPDLFGCGGFDDPTLEPAGFFARNESEMQTQATYEGWDFANTWAIDPARNGGYPYLTWQDMPLTGLALSAKTVILSVGDTAWLTVVSSPTHADLSQVEWTSSDESVVTVDQNGMLTAAGEGEAVITASCGSISDSCAVTVNARAFTEYRLGKLTLRGENGSKLSAIPKGRFFVTVPVTKQEDGGDALILLAAYTAQGKFRGLMYVSVKGLPAGAAVEVTLPIDNARGDIAVIKAFPIASFTNPVPLGEGVTFQ